MRSLPRPSSYILPANGKTRPRDGHYVLTADIDMTGVKGFKPIASKKEEGFTGTFDGQFHSIKGLRIEYEKKYAGLFGYVGNQDDQAYIKNVALLDCYVTGQQNVGALAGVNYGTITDCVVTGEVKCLESVQLAYRGRYLRQAEGGRRPDRRPCRGLLRQRRRFRAV